MKISDIIGMSLTNLWRRKMRTALTVLGVIIGTASIVVMLSLGLGLRESMLAEVGTAGGLTEIMVSSDADYGTDELLLSDSTIETFMGIDHVENVQPELWYGMPIQAGKYENSIQIVGVTDEYMQGMELAQGNYPESGANLSLVFGNQVLTEFQDIVTGDYPYWENGEVPNIDLMRTPIIGGIEKEEVDSGTDDTTTSDSSTGYVNPDFAVSGNDNENNDDFSTEEDFSSDDNFSLDDSGDWDDGMSYSMFSSSMKRVQIKTAGVITGDLDTYTEYSYNCYARIDDLKDFLKKNYSLNEIIPGQPTNKDGKPYRELMYTQFIVKVDESANVEEVLETIQDMGYRADANKEWLEEIEKEFLIIEAVLGGIGAVAMLVAAISIANTMTMSIYERTKEIGIMKVLGCGLGNIRSMFLSEAAFIGFLGGVMGICLSYLLSFALNKLAPSFAGEIDIVEGVNISQIPPWLVLLAVLFATLIGMIAGFFPAQRATKLSPLAAIRNE